MVEWFVKDKGKSVEYVGERGGWRKRPRKGSGFRCRGCALLRLDSARKNHRLDLGFGPFVLVRVGKP